MHFSKAILLFAGSSVAVPLVGLGFDTADIAVRDAGLYKRAVTTTSSVKPTSTVKSTSTPAPSATGLTAAQGSSIIADLNAFDTATNSAYTALNAFTGGSSIATQANNVATAGNAWQAATLKVLNDAKALTGKGQFTAANSTTVATLLSGTIATDLVKTFNLLKNKKSLFAQVGSVKNVHDGLAALMGEFQNIAETLIPMIRSADLSNLQTATSQVNPAAEAAYNAYAS